MWLFLSMALAADPPAGPDFLALMSTERPVRRKALRRIGGDFDVASVPMALEVLRFQTEDDVVDGLWRWLDAGAGQPFARDREAAFAWVWAQTYEPHDDYAVFKAALYRAVDPRFEQYFRPGQTAKIRLDEVRWGGVKQDGIPPLRDPWVEAAAEATWLGEADVVFGVEIGGEARAWPKRILAWHEMVVDDVGGVRVAGVYCTLCGSMIVYGTEVDGHAYQLGTSGFLYRSNKLMFDAATNSLWSTLGGTPVIGPLADRDVELPIHPVVTTTWGAWRARHPDTTVMTRLTGHERDYSEGAAYRDYFATDELMFSVPGLDPRLKNKDEVLALRSGDDQLAMSSAWLAEHPVHHDKVGGRSVVVLTDASGASRVYEAGDVRFERFDGPSAVDDQGRTWAWSEAALSFEEQRLLRVPAHRAFWFGWVSAWPETRLVP